jgi:glucose-1-phosphate cytidylyltransferase
MKEWIMTKDNIPVVILSGGNGTMLGASSRRPKTMVEIGGHPLLDYVIAYFVRAGFRKFIIAAGQGRELIELFVKREIAHWAESGISVDVVDTGLEENTGARLAKLKPLLKGSARTILTYGDVLADVSLDKLLQFHDAHGRMATLTAVHAPTRFRILGLHNVRDEVLGFADKPILQKDYISGGFYVLSEKVLDVPGLTEAPGCSFEFNVLQDLVLQKQVMAFRHDGYWQALDTERDMEKLGQYVKDFQESNFDRS